MHGAEISTDTSVNFLLYSKSYPSIILRLNLKTLST